MSTLFLPAGGRELANWSIDGALPGDPIEMSFDYGVTWSPMTFDGTDWTVWIAGPDAVTNPGDVVLGEGLHQAIIRKAGVGVLLRDAGLVSITGDCPRWPVDWSCWSGGDLTTDQRERAETLAVSTLRFLTGYMVGNCPGTIHVHAPGRCDRIGFTPHLYGGVWRNDSPCGSLVSGALLLPGPIASVDEIVVEGETVAPEDYYIDGYSVRLFEGRWPTGDIDVTYTRGFTVDYLGAVAAGMLASEYANACIPGRKCALPAGVTSLVRQGVTIELRQDLFAGGLTGVRAVDTFTARYNPYRLQSLPTIYSPDLGL